MSFGATKLLSASGGKAYEIDQSLLLDSGDSAYLSKTPSSAGNLRTWTLSFWVKRARLSYLQCMYGAANGSSGATDYGIIYFDSYDALGFYYNSSTIALTNRKFRDVSAWYHIYIKADTTQSTASDRWAIYINGVQETSFSESNTPSQNQDMAWNNNIATNVGGIPTSSSYYFDGYMAEFHNIDGTVKPVTDFGETDDLTGAWIPKKYTGGSYGTNGFYLKFASGAIGTDSSGEGNNWTANNVGNGDVLLDTPTNNFPTVNFTEPWNTTVSDLRQGNLNIKAATFSSGNYGNHFITFILPTSGKWYFEWLTGIQAGLANNAQVGVTKQGPSGIIIPNQSQAAYTFGSSTALVVDIYGNTADLYDGGSSIDQDTGLTATTYVCAIAIDIDNNKFYAGYDNGSSITWLNSGNPATGSNGAAHTFDSDSGIYASTTVNSANSNRSYVILNFGQNGTFSNYKTAGGNADGAGIGNFYYSPPSGFKALCQKNLPSVTIKKSSEHFDTVIYTGNNSNRNITSYNFQPDFLWLKSRESTYWHRLIDAVRGSTRSLHSDNDQVELVDDYGTVGGFLSNGFSLRAGTGSNASHAGTNASGDDMVAWAWKANGSGGANTDGSINSTVSANTTAGFSIVTYTGTGSNATVGHGLGVAPSVILVKNRESATNWLVYSRNDATDYLVLNDARASTDDNTIWNDTAPTSSVFSIGTTSGTNTSGDDIVAYCFAEVEGFSKFGRIYGNGSSNGPYIYTGFRPAWIMIKRTDTADYWWGIFDNKRDPINVADAILYANDTYVEDDSDSLDILSNGFKLRANSAFINANTGIYLYMAFSELPFKTPNAR